MKSLAGKLTSGITRLAGFGRQSGDPLTNLKAATRWLDNLPVGDVLKCQQAILEELKRFNENPSEPTKVRLGVLMLLDEKSRDLQDTLVHQYLRNPRMSRPVESQLWHAVYSLHWEVARGYHTFVLHFARGSSKSPHDGQIPLITLRALRAFGQLLKWRAVRYLGPGEKLWLRLHNLYRVAESEGFQRQSQIAYAGEKPCSCESAYLHAMMLNLANSGTLYPRQIDLLDRWLCQWHDYLALDAGVDAGRHAFTVDLSVDHGPRRVRKTGNDKPARYWATGELLDKLEDTQRALREGGAPAALGLGEAARPGESIDLLEHLRQHWSPLAAREQRRAKPPNDWSTSSRASRASSVKSRQASPNPPPRSTALASMMARPTMSASTALSPSARASATPACKCPLWACRRMPNAGSCRTKAPAATAPSSSRATGTGCALARCLR